MVSSYSRFGQGLRPDLQRQRFPSKVGQPLRRVPIISKIGVLFARFVDRKKSGHPAERLPYQLVDSLSLNVMCLHTFGPVCNQPNPTLAPPGPSMG